MRLGFVGITLPSGQVGIAWRIGRMSGEWKTGSILPIGPERLTGGGRVYGLRDGHFGAGYHKEGTRCLEVSGMWGYHSWKREEIWVGGHRNALAVVKVGMVN